MPSDFFPLTRSPVRARLLAMMAALVALFVSTSAFATPAPMCDEEGQSIAAPFPILPNDNGEVRATTPCGTQPSYELGTVPTPDRQISSTSDTVERVLPVGIFTLPRDRGRQLPPGEALPDASRPGHALGVFRPPRSS